MPETIKHAIVEMFADDTKLYQIINNEDDARKFQSAIDDFLHWCDVNLLEPNIAKCNVMSITRKKEPLTYAYQLGDKLLNRVSEHKDLGVIENTKLIMNQHIEKKYINIARGMLGLIKRSCGGVFQINTLRILYMALVRSHLDYANVVYNPSYDVHKNRIESIQRQFVMYALRHTEQRDENYRLRPYIGRCNDINLESLERRRINSGILFVYDLIERNLLASTLNERLKFTEQTRYELRNNRNQLEIPTHSTNYLHNAPLTTMSRNFNNIIDIYETSNNRKEFVKLVKDLPNSHFGIE